MSVDVVILAAGKGSRMKSSIPKVLHSIAGKPMVQHVVDKASLLSKKIHLVVGHGADHLESYFEGQVVDFSLQAEQLGTGHAVEQAMPKISNPDATVLILYGDVPLTQEHTLQELVDQVTDQSMGLLTVTLKSANGYGRIVRDEHEKVLAIVEHKDATAQQLAIKEINTGIMAVKAGWLQRMLPKLQSNNAQGEYYLTDIIEMAVEEGFTVNTVSPDNAEETYGVNDRVQMAELERWYQLQLANDLMRNGATLADPSRVDIRGNVEVAGDVEIDVNAVFEGNVKLGKFVKIGPNAYIKDAVIEDGTEVYANSHIEGAQIGVDCQIGPFARIRPETVLEDEAKLGNFVEAKKTVVGRASKLSHFIYAGDAKIGSGVNVGAGTITCNYDGINKNQTVIGDGAFVGANSTLVAPVTIESGAIVGAGSVISRTAPKDKLTLARTAQTTVESWEKVK